jgi:hypothetical protein
MRVGKNFGFDESVKMQHKQGKSTVIKHYNSLNSLVSKVNRYVNVYWYNNLGCKSNENEPDDLIV